jgi:uncharacterized membrane protein YdjX (TVP38/TMEM64 family)
MSRWIAADWFHKRIENRMEKIRKLDEMLGHNGLLVVITVRLIHVLPFGLCNYALGITQVSLLDIAIGTLLGHIPAISFYVGMGTPYFRDWRFFVVLASINVILLAPWLLRYFSSQRFKKIGVE